MARVVNGSSGASMNDLISKMRSPDMDFRYMALNDLLNELQKTNTAYDDSTAARLIDAVLKTLEDKNGEVQNMGVKCLGPLVRRSKEASVQAVVDRLCKADTGEELRDISSTALRTVILEVSPTSSVATNITRRLVPKLLAQMNDLSNNSDVLLDSLDVLVELLGRFNRAVTTLPSEDESNLVRSLTTLLDNSRPAVRKRTVVAVGTLAAQIPLEAFSRFMSEIIQMLSIARSNEKLKTLISLAGEICRVETDIGGSSRFSDYLQTILPAVFNALQLEDDDLREVSLQSMESFVYQGGSQIKRYDNQIIQIALKFLKYDPNYDVEADDDEDMEEASDSLSDLGSDFEDDEQYDDDDDTSWKLRRCAAKLITALVKAQPDILATSFSQIGPALVARFNEREENVRIEILQTFANVMTSFGSSSSRPSSPSRKRSRQDEDEMEVEVTATRQSTIAALLPRVIRQLVKLLNEKSVATKQVCFLLLKELCNINCPSLDSHFDLLLPSIETALTDSTATLNSSTSSNLKISALEFVTSFIQAYPTSASSHLEVLLPLLLQPLQQDKLNKILLISLQALNNLMQVASSTNSTKAFTEICKVLFEKSTLSDIEQEVRDELIKTIGQAISNSPAELDESILQEARNILLLKLKNESTRSSAISTISRLAASDPDLDKAWASNATHEVLKYTNHSNKTLRTSAITAMIPLVKISGPLLDKQDVKTISQIVNSQLESEDTQLVPLVLAWLDATVQNISLQEQQVVCGLTIAAVMKLVSTSMSTSTSSTFEYLSSFVHIASRSIGSTEVVRALEGMDMSSINLANSAKFIAIAIMEDTKSEHLAQYEKDIRGTKTSENSRALALYILGECAQANDISPEITNLVLAQFNSPSEKVRSAAATGFGNIVARDVDTNLPQVFDRMSKTADDHYLLALSLKETIIKSSDGERADRLASHAHDLWSELFKLAVDDRAKNIVAECVGRLTLLRPNQLLPELQTEIKADSATSRAVVIRAIRYTFTAASTDFDEQLRPFVVDFLSLMEDEDLNIRRLALSTLYSAAHNKPHLIQNHLDRLLPLLYQETSVRKDLIHTVQMGPFKHIVDDGLELRKSAFETLHTLLDSFLPHVHLPDVYPILIRGLDDVHEIKTLCFLMLSFLASAAPETMTTELDTIAEVLQRIMAVKLKDSAVKQDKEKDHEVKRSALRCLVSLQPCANDGTVGFNTILEEVKSTKGKEIGEL